MDRTTQMLASELRGRDRVLEVGVGTGLLALPLHEAGVPVRAWTCRRGCWRSSSRRRRRVPFPLVLGDATRMPFADDAFGGA